MYSGTLFSRPSLSLCIWYHSLFTCSRFQSRISRTDCMYCPCTWAFSALLLFSREPSLYLRRVFSFWIFSSRRCSSTWFIPSNSGCVTLGSASIASSASSLANRSSNNLHTVSNLTMEDPMERGVRVLLVPQAGKTSLYGIQ